MTVHFQLFRQVVQNTTEQLKSSICDNYHSGGYKSGPQTKAIVTDVCILGKNCFLIVRERSINTSNYP